MSNNKTDYKHKPDRILSVGILVIYVFLAIFGIVSIIGPSWFTELTDKGKADELQIVLYYADGLSQSGRYEEALTLYNEVIELDPGNAKALTNKAINYLLMDNPGMAREYLNKALGAEQANPDLIYFYLGEIDYNTGFKIKAAASYLKSASYSPFPIFQYRKLANLYFEQKNWTKASEYYKLALANKPDLRNSYIGMLKRDSHLFPGRDDITREIKTQLNENLIDNYLEKYDPGAFVKMLSRDRSIALDWNRLGYCHTIENDYKNAAKCFKEAINIWPAYKEARKNLSLAREKMKNPAN